MYLLRARVGQYYDITVKLTILSAMIIEIKQFLIPKYQYHDIIANITEIVFKSTNDFNHLLIILVFAVLLLLYLIIVIFAIANHDICGDNYHHR